MRSCFLDEKYTFTNTTKGKKFDLNSVSFFPLFCILFCGKYFFFSFFVFSSSLYFRQTFTLVKDYPRMIGNFSNSSRSYVTVYYKAFCDIYMYTRTIRLCRKKESKKERKERSQSRNIL